MLPPSAPSRRQDYGILRRRILLRQHIDNQQFSHFKAAPHNGARRFGERFCLKRKYEKCGNTLCISHFSYCTVGAKDPPKPAAPIMRCCLISYISKKARRKSMQRAFLNSSLIRWARSPPRRACTGGRRCRREGCPPRKSSRRPCTRSLSCP